MSVQSPVATDGLLSAADVDAAQPRVGKTPTERLEWAVWFTQADLRALTRGDWLNLRLELSAFAGVLIREHDREVPLRLRERRAAPTAGESAVFAEDDVRELHGEFARVIGRLLQSDSVVVGTYQVTLTVERWLPPAQGMGRPVRLRTTFPLGTSRATHVLAHLLGIYGHLVKECPAPRPRGAKDERCGRWFLARRPNQVYCTTRCQSRATTRASREGMAERGPQARRRGDGRRQRRRRT